MLLRRLLLIIPLVGEGCDRGASRLSAGGKASLRLDEATARFVVADSKQFKELQYPFELAFSHDSLLSVAEKTPFWTVETRQAEQGKVADVVTILEDGAEHFGSISYDAEAKLLIGTTSSRIPKRMGRVESIFPTSDPLSYEVHFDYKIDGFLHRVFRPGGVLAVVGDTFNSDTSFGSMAIVKWEEGAWRVVRIEP